jgi:ABC-type phosphate transport system substrate-binding protein
MEITGSMVLLKQPTIFKAKEKIMKTVIYILLISISLLAEEIVIANTSDKDLTSDDIKQIYLGKRKLWSDGTKISLVTFKSGAITDSFMKNFLNKKTDQFLIYWKQLMFTGRGSMPKLVSSEEEMIEYVKETPGAIGYVSESVIEGVKIITVTKEEE